MTELCSHEKFEAETSVTRLTDSGRFVFEVKVHCTECGAMSIHWESGSEPDGDAADKLLDLMSEPEGEKRLFSGSTIHMPKLPEKV